MTQQNPQRSFTVHRTVAMAVDPIHVGTGGSRLGRVDNSIVRDPVTRIPKIPGSSLAGVHRAYAAMALEDERTREIYQDPRGEGRKDEEGKPRPFYPNCAGQGQTKGQEHCGDRACPICSTFGHASFAGLAAFSDAQVLLFPVPTREGPIWVTSPGALRFIGVRAEVKQDVVCRETDRPLNLGWLLLPSEKWPDIRIDRRDEAKEDAEHSDSGDDQGDKTDDNRKHSECGDAQGGALTKLQEHLRGYHVPEYVRDSLALVSNKLFGHVVNSNLEVRTSVAINPATGAAEDGALFTYEALPRATVLLWDVTFRDPRHFGRGQEAKPHETVKKAHPLLEALGIGGMGSRGMGRLRVLCSKEVTR